MAKATINPGICGFTTTVQADSEDGMMVQFAIETDCERMKKLAEVLPEVNAFTELGAGYDGEIFMAAREKAKPCNAGCVVPAGIFKTMQIAADLSLPKEVSMELDRNG